MRKTKRGREIASFKIFIIQTIHAIKVTSHHVQHSIFITLKFLCSMHDQKSRRENAIDTNSRTICVYHIGYSSRNKVTFFSNSKNRFNHTYWGIVNSQLMYAVAYTGFFRDGLVCDE